jgi:hypothetical protein
VRMECKEVEAVVETDKHGVKRIREIKGIKWAIKLKQHSQWSMLKK